MLALFCLMLANKWHDGSALASRGDLCAWPQFFVCLCATHRDAAWGRLTKAIHGHEKNLCASVIWYVCGLQHGNNRVALVECRLCTLVSLRKRRTYSEGRSFPCRVRMNPTHMIPPTRALLSVRGAGMICYRLRVF
jgi:hypothetical protein